MADNTAQIVLTANTSKFASEFSRAANSARSAAGQITNALNGIKGAMGALGVGLSFAGMAAFVKNSIDAADALNDLSKRTGVAATTIGGIGFAAQQAGGDLEGAAVAFKSFNKTISEALGGNREAIDNFAKLGISLKDLKSLSPDKLLIKAADAFSQFADGAEKAAGATVFFGKGAASVAGLLDEGGASLQRNIEYYKRYSGVTDDLVRASDEFNDSLTKLSLLNRSFGNYVASALLPSLQNLADYLLDARENSNAFETAAQGVADTIKALAKFAVSGATTFQQFAFALAATAAQLKLIASLDFSGIAEVERALQENIAASEERARGLMRAIDGVRKASGADQAPRGGAARGGRAAPNFTKAGAGGAKEADEYAKALERVQKELRVTQTEYAALFSNEVLTKAQKELAAFTGSEEWKKLTAPQQENIKRIYEQTAALEKQADAFKKSQEAAEKEGKALQDLNEQQERARAQFTESLGSYAEDTDRLRKEIALVGQDEVAYKKLAETLDFNRLAKQALVAGDVSGMAVLEELHAKRMAMIDELAAKVREMNNTEQIRNIFADNFADQLAQVVDGTKSLSDAFRDMERQIVASISRIAAQNIAEAIFGKSGGTGGFGDFASFFGKMLSGAFASGTNFAPGGMALVGERGPEIVNLPRGASVTPNNKIGGNVISINVNVPGGTSRASADQIALQTGVAVQRAMARIG